VFILLNKIDDYRAHHARIYLDEHGTLQGEQAAWEWWRDPRIKCAIFDSPRGVKRCGKPCEFCIGIVTRTNVHST
jgi:hypothetical protein